jgi:hypothetical protein
MLQTLFSDGAAWFSVPALLGTGVFLISLILTQFGADDADFTGDASLSGSHGHGSSDWFGIKPIACFLMGFGWGALGAFRGSSLGILPSVFIGLGCGVVLTIAFIFLLRMAMKLTSSGNIDAASVVGQGGVVYIEVTDRSASAPATGLGKVRVVMGNRTKTLSAVAEAGEGTIPSGTPVKIIRLNPDQSAVVSAKM